MTIDQPTDLDRAIDTVARGLTNGEPSPEFRARVMAALPAPERRTWRRALVPAAAIAALALAFVLKELPRSPNSAEPGAIPVPQIAAGPAETAGPAEETAARVGRVAAVAAGPAAIGPDEAAWLSRAVRPLPPLDVLVIEPIQPERLSIAPMSVAPIVTAPIEVPPLDARAGGRE